MRTVSGWLGHCRGLFQELSDRTGMPLATVRDLVEKLKWRGAIGRVLAKPDYYRLFPAMIELRDSSIMNPDAPWNSLPFGTSWFMRKCPRWFRCWKPWILLPWCGLSPLKEALNPRGGSWTLTRQESCLRMQRWLRLSPVPAGLRPKSGQRQGLPGPSHGHVHADRPVCRSHPRQGLGERLTNEEALKRLGEAEDAGLVHLIRNNWKKDMFMCNCCSCCCTGLFMINQAGYAASYAPSRFRVKLDAELCTGCGNLWGPLSVSCHQDERYCAHRSGEMLRLRQLRNQMSVDALILEEIRPKTHIRITWSAKTFRTAGLSTLATSWTSQRRFIFLDLKRI